MRKPFKMGWNFVFHVEYDYFRRSWGWRRVEIGVLKMHTEPDDGEMPTHDKHYKGFWFRLLYWLPFEIVQVR